MPKPDLKATVASLAKVALKTGGVFVFATRDANLPRSENVSAEIAEYPFAEHTCKSCNATFAALKVDGLKNHCIACGGDKVVATTKPAKRTIPADPQLSYLSCSACGTHSVFASSLGKELAGAMKCTTCGTSHSYQHASDEYADDSEETLDMDDMELLDLDDGADEPEVIAEEKKDDETQADATSTGDPEAKPAPLPEAGPSSGKPPEDPQKDTPSSEGNQESPAPDDSGTTGSADDMPNNDYEMSMLDTVAKSETASFAYIGKQVAMLCGTKIVATLSPEDAGDNKDMLQTEAFRQAVAHVIGKQGVQAAAKHFGFKAVTIKVPVKAMVEKAVDARTADKAAQVTASLDQTAEQFQHAVDIAAAGFAGNFWRNKHDPLKAAMIRELSSLGIPNAQKVVDRVCEANSVAQMREVIAHARDLANKPPEALNGLAQAIGLAKYQPAMVKASDEDEGDDAEEAESDEDYEDTESTVTTIASAVDDESETEAVTAGVIQYKDPSIAAILKGKPIF